MTFPLSSHLDLSSRVIMFAPKTKHWKTAYSTFVRIVVRCACDYSSFVGVRWFRKGVCKAPVRFVSSALQAQRLAFSTHPPAGTDRQGGGSSEAVNPRTLAFGWTTRQPDMPLVTSTSMVTLAKRCCRYIGPMEVANSSELFSNCLIGIWFTFGRFSHPS